MIGHDGIWQRFYFSVKLGAGGFFAPDANNFGINSFRPFHHFATNQPSVGADYDDKNSATTTDNRYFNSTGLPALPGQAPDAPWTQPGESPAGAMIVHSLAFVGGPRREIYVVVPLDATLNAQRQALYRCDQWASAATLVKNHWESSAFATSSRDFRCVDLCHCSLGNTEALAALSICDTQDSWTIQYFDFDGVELPFANRPSGRPTINGRVHGQLTANVPLWLCRGEPGTDGGLFGGVLVQEYPSGVSDIPTRSRFEVHNFNLRTGTLLVASDWNVEDVGVFWGQPTFDFINRRLLWTEQKVTINNDGSGLRTVPVKSGLKQLKRNNTNGSWSSANTTLSDVPGFAFPLATQTDDSDSDFITIAPALEPKVCWYNANDDRIYVNFNQRYFGAGIEGLVPYAGIVAFNLDGSNPQIVCLSDFADFSDRVGGWGLVGNEVALGWGCRAYWEL